MAEHTSISWATSTWNPVSGCFPVSEGCAHCYAKRITERFGGDFSKVTLHPDRLEIPLHWRKPRRIFVCSMGDLFHEDVPDSFIAEVFDVMARAKQHSFLVLTKRPARMAAWLDGIAAIAPGCCKLPGGYGWTESEPWPLTNCWLGVTAEIQRLADERIPILLDTPAAHRFVSCEPLLSGLDLTPWFWEGTWHRETYPSGSYKGRKHQHRRQPGLDLVIVGGESGGPPERALVERCQTASGIPFHRLNIEGEPPERAGRIHKPCGGTGWQPKPEALEWVRSLRDQCEAAGVPFHLKGWGGPRPTSGGHLLDGKEWREMAT